jgi:hypothetical protein
MRLTEPQPDNIQSTGWVEGSRETNVKLFHMAEDLRQDDLIAIFYPANSHSAVKCAWVAWSHGSPSFNFPPRSTKELPLDVEIPLLVAAHAMLRPIEVLGPRIPYPFHEKSQEPSLDRSLSLRTGISEVSKNAETDKPSRRSSFHNDTIMRKSFQTQDTWMPILAQDSSMQTQGDFYSPTEPVTNDSLVRTQSVSYSHSSESAPQYDPPTSNYPTVNVEAKALFESYMTEHGIQVEELATIYGDGKIYKAQLFYLHFPSDDELVQNELTALSVHLRFHGMTVSTNLDPEGLAKFVQNSRMGVVIVCSGLPVHRKPQLIAHSSTNHSADTTICSLLSPSCFPNLSSISG